MKTLIVALMVVTGLASAQEAPVEIKWDVLNRAMKTIADRVVRNDEFVVETFPEWDLKACDLAQEKLTYSVEGRLKSTPWSPGQNTLITSSLSVRGVHGAEPGIHHDSVSLIKTNSVELFRHTAQIALNELNLEGPQEEYVWRVKDQLRKFSTASSLTEIYTLLQANVALAQEIVDFHLEKSVANLEEAIKSGSDSIKNYEANVAEFRQMRRAYQKISIQARTETGIVQAIRIEHSDPAGFLATSSAYEYQPREVSVVFHENDFVTTIGGFLPQTRDDMARLKAELTQSLIKLQSGDRDEEDRVEHAFEDALAAFSSVIKTGKGK